MVGSALRGADVAVEIGDGNAELPSAGFEFVFARGGENASSVLQRPEFAIHIGGSLPDDAGGLKGIEGEDAARID